MSAETSVLSSAEMGRSRSAAADPARPRARRRYLSEPNPWRRVNLTRALIPVALGLLVAFVGWWKVAGEVTLEDQQGWLILAFLGAAIAALGGVYWLLVNLREVRIGQRQLVADLADVLDWPLTRDGRVRRTSLIGTVTDATASDPGQPQLVTGPGMTLVHVADCPIAKGKAVREITAADAAEQGLDRCGMCLSSRSAR